MPDTTTPAAQADPATGTVTLRINGTDYRFNPPTLGQYRRLEEMTVARAEQVAAERAEKLAALPEGETPVPTFDETWAPRLRDFAWWRTAYGLCGDGKDFPTDDDLPLWLTQDLSAAAMVHWTRFPTEALGGASLGAISRLLELVPSEPAANGVNG